MGYSKKKTVKEQELWDSLSRKQSLRSLYRQRVKKLDVEIEVVRAEYHAERKKPRKPFS